MNANSERVTLIVLYKIYYVSIVAKFRGQNLYLFCRHYLSCSTNGNSTPAHATRLLAPQQHCHWAAAFYVIIFPVNGWVNQNVAEKWNWTCYSVSWHWTCNCRLMRLAFDTCVKWSTLHFSVHIYLDKITGDQYITSQAEATHMEMSYKLNIHGSDWKQARFLILASVSSACRRGTSSVPYTSECFVSLLSCHKLARKLWERFCSLIIGTAN